MQSVKELMTSPVHTVHSGDPVASVRKLMGQHRITAVPVMDEQGGLAGIVTASDLVDPVWSKSSVTAVMTDRVRTIDPALSVEAAARAMVDHHLHHLVVLDHDGAVVGILSSFDILRGLAGAIPAPSTGGVPGRKQARPGDVIVIQGRNVGQSGRRAVVVEARGADDGPPFVVNWLDDAHDEPHDVLFFPGSDATIEHHADQPA